MNADNWDTKRNRVKQSLLTLCEESGVLMVEKAEEFFDEHLVESGMVDSLGIVYLQDQIETHYQITISQEQIVAELHTLEKITQYLVEHTAASALR